MKLIANWRNAWRLATVRISALAVVWVALPAETQAAVLHVLHIDKSYLPGIVGIAVIVARLIDQPKARK